MSFAISCVSDFKPDNRKPFVEKNSKTDLPKRRQSYWMGGLSYLRAIEMVRVIPLANFHLSSPSVFVHLMRSLRGDSHSDFSKRNGVKLKTNLDI